MPLEYDDIPGSWATQSEGWPETPYTEGKWLLCTKAGVIPYASYVKVGDVLRVETEAMKEKLEKVYDDMFIRCNHIITKDPSFKPTEDLDKYIEMARWIDSVNGCVSQAEKDEFQKMSIEYFMQKFRDKIREEHEK